jgi:hypothetical protein
VLSPGRPAVWGFLFVYSSYAKECIVGPSNPDEWGRMINVDAIYTVHSG